MPWITVRRLLLAQRTRLKKPLLWQPGWLASLSEWIQCSPGSTCKALFLSNWSRTGAVSSSVMYFARNAAVWPVRWLAGRKPLEKPENTYSYRGFRRCWASDASWSFAVCSSLVDKRYVFSVGRHHRCNENQQSFATMCHDLTT